MGQLFSKRIRLEDISPDDIIIVVIGPSGAGKSTFINTTAGRPLLRVSSGLAPCTTKVSHVRCTIQLEGSLKHVVLVDTPAFPDPGINDTAIAGLEVEMKVRNWLKQTCGKKRKIGGILYLYKINENRMTQPPLPHYQMFQRLCGEGFHTRVLLVTTMWEKLSNQADGERRKEILKRHWSVMIDKGSAVVCHYGDKESAWGAIKALVGTEKPMVNLLKHATDSTSTLVGMDKETIDCRANSPGLTTRSTSPEPPSSQKQTVPMPATPPPPRKPDPQSFHSAMLPNLHVSVYYALTTFETEISPWMHPSQWLDANTKHIRSIFDGIADLNENKEAITFPATLTFQRLIVYLFAYSMLCSGDKTLLSKFNATLKKCQDWDILNLMRNQGNIRNELSNIFRNASPEHREKKFEDLLRKLLVLDSISLSANIEVLIADETACQDLVDTRGAGAQSLVNLLHARLDFPMDSEHKRLLVRALTRLSGTSGLYPESLTLTNVTPERGRRAAGGFADVYKGRCLGEDVAIKVFKIPLPCGVDSLNSWRSSDNHFGNLMHEFITWRQLSHPNVLPFYGVHFLEDPLENRFSLVSPWMENGNIVEFLARRHRMAPYTDSTDCVSLAFDIAHGVKYLHGQKIVHRDLKGYNILISPSLRAYIADFGLATLTASGCATTLAGSAVMGTPRWLAPELIPHAQVKRHHTYASDIYAFALVCYEMFSGQVPFGDVEMHDLKSALERGQRPTLPADSLSQRRGLRLEMENLIRDCWAQEPTKRPSADEVVERLQLLQLVDQRLPNEIGTSFFTKLLRDQVDNPFAILSREYHGA